MKRKTWPAHTITWETSPHTRMHGDAREDKGGWGGVGSDAPTGFFAAVKPHVEDAHWFSSTTGRLEPRCGFVKSVSEVLRFD
jgi:hypothetical protein